MIESLMLIALWCGNPAYLRREAIAVDRCRTEAIACFKGDLKKYDDASAVKCIQGIKL